jgi:hypothetical protein
MTVALTLSLIALGACAMPPMPPPAANGAGPNKSGATASPAAATPAETGCASNDQCKGGRLCIQGDCVAPVDAATTKRVEGGAADLSSLTSLVKTKTCVTAPGVNDLLTKAATPKVDVADLKSRMAGTNAQYPELVGDWLLVARRYLRTCGADEQAEVVAKAADQLAAVVAEKTIEDAVRRVDCSSLSIVHDAKLWPYEQRFSKEVVARRFGDAEVTRRVWTESLSTFSKECEKRLNTRQRVAVKAQLDNLDRIIGLDDAMLIDLRTKLLSAMEKGDANAIATLSNAISQREGVLDQRHNNDQVKQLEIRTRIAEKKRQAAESELASAKRGPAAGTNDAQTAVDSTQNAVNTAQNAVQTAKNVHDTVNMARSIFGF